MIDDLRPCLAHRIPINRCAPCWPLFLNHLGALSRPKENEAKMLAILAGAQAVGYLKKKVRVRIYLPNPPQGGRVGVV